MTNIQPAPGPRVDTYRFLEFELDVRNACLRHAGLPVPLRPKSFDVLLYLVRHRGRLVTKDELIEAVWAPVVVTENSLVQCVREAREAIGDASQSRIETVAKRGYIFTPEVAEGSAGSPPAASRRRSRRVMALAALVAVGLAIAVSWIGLGPEPARDEAARRFAVAVLPFDSPAEPDYFSRGISDDVTAALGRFPQLAVAAPLAVARLRTAGATAEDLQRQLKLRYLVEGSVRRSP